MVVDPAAVASGDKEGGQRRGILPETMNKGRDDGMSEVGVATGRCGSGSGWGWGGSDVRVRVKGECIYGVRE